MSHRQHCLVIYAKDVQRLTGRQKASSYRLLGKIRKKFALPGKALATVEHFCDYTGLKKQDVFDYLRAYVTILCEKRHVGTL